MNSTSSTAYLQQDIGSRFKLYLYLTRIERENSYTRELASISLRYSY